MLSQWSFKISADLVIRRFSPIPKPSVANMNWTVLVFGIVAVFSAVYYAVGGRKSFKPPIRHD